MNVSIGPITEGWLLALTDMSCSPMERNGSLLTTSGIAIDRLSKGSKRMADEKKERIVEKIGLADGFTLEAYIGQDVVQIGADIGRIMPKALHWRIVHSNIPTVVRLSAAEALAIIQMQRV